MKRILYILFVFSVFIRCASSELKESETTQVETCFLNKFKKMNARFRIYEDGKDYQILSSKKKEDADLYFGWIYFRIENFNNSTEAKEALEKIRTGNVDRFKAPEYIIRYSNKIYFISSGCFNVDGVDMAFGLFRSCIDSNKLKENDIIAVECGGRLIPVVL